MSKKSQSVENIPLEEAISRLTLGNQENTLRIERLEDQVKQILLKTEHFERRLDEVHLQVTSGQSQMLTTLEETKQQFHEFKENTTKQFDLTLSQNADIMKIIEKFNEIEKLREQNLSDRRDAINEHVSLTEDGQSSFLENNPYEYHENNIRRSILIPPTTTQNYKTSILTPPIASTPISRTQITMLPPSAIPTFSGKHSERPYQFLTRIQEYAETMQGWDRNTLLQGISQFMKDSALDWYCQLRSSYRRPRTWPEFVDLFLAQFNSPIRRAQLEQEWHECKQRENETVSEFLTRLRLIWSDHKPHESEQDLAKHLLRKIRNDVFTTMGISPGATLDDILYKAQETEEIIFRRKRDQRRSENFKQYSTSNSYRQYNDNYFNQNNTMPYTNAIQPYNDKNKNVLQDEYDNRSNWKTNKSPQKANYNVHFTTTNNNQQSPNHQKHYIQENMQRNARNNQNNQRKTYQTPPKEESKNEQGAFVTRRDINARC